MNYLFLLVAGIVGIHAYTFARWLGGNGNSSGAMGVYMLIIISLALPLYRIINGS